METAQNPLEAVRSWVERVAQDQQRDSTQRATELLRIRDDLEVVLGACDEYIGRERLFSIASADVVTQAVERLRSNAHARAKILSRGGATAAELEAAGYYDSAELDRLEEEGLLEAMAVHVHELQEAHTSTMVALFPDAASARKLAKVGTETVREIHLTLAFLGQLSGDTTTLLTTVKGFAAACPPIKGEVSGTGFFTAGEDKVAYASVDCPGLPHQRERLLELLRGAGYPPSMQHGYTPHITLAYGEEHEIAHIAAPSALKLRFDRITVAIADKRISYKLVGNKDELLEAGGQEIITTEEEHGSDAGDDGSPVIDETREAESSDADARDDGALSS